MEMLVIGLIAIAAFAAVLVPLFRRRPGYGDESEFENIPPAPTVPPDAADTSGSLSPPAGDAAPAASGDAPPPAIAATDATVAPSDPMETEVLRYREAVRAGTVCRKCGQANPADSQYCYECGARLPLADAKEFE